MNPALELRQLLSGRTQTLAGEVVSVDGTGLKVRTTQGVIDARSAEAFAVGDAVLVRGGVVQGRIKPAASVPVYFV